MMLNTYLKQKTKIKINTLPNFRTIQKNCQLKGTSTLCGAAHSGTAEQGRTMLQVYVDVASAQLRHAVRYCVA